MPFGGSISASVIRSPSQRRRISIKVYFLCGKKKITAYYVSSPVLDRVEDIKMNKNITCLPKTDVFILKKINVYCKYKSESTKIK